MTTLLLQQILATVVHALPRLFLVGAPILLIVMAVAAFVDARSPWSTDHTVQAHPAEGLPAPRHG